MNMENLDEKHINIYGRLFTVKYVDGKEMDTIASFSGGNRYWGLKADTDSIIYIRKNMQDIHEKTTVLHEIIHAIFDTHHILDGIDNDNEERIVESAAIGLITLFKNNPHLIKYLTNDE